jgi:nicotinate-nucleotide pyrophosphorylase (carboxylating)
VNAKPQLEHSAREAQLRRALFRGQQLHMGDDHYRAAAAAVLDPLLFSDAGCGDLTAEALGLTEGRAKAQVLAKESGIAAGLEEFEWLLTRGDLAVKAFKRDGEKMDPGDVLAEIEGGRGGLLSCERTGLNLLQRMSGIATMTHRLQERAQRRNAKTFVRGGLSAKTEGGPAPVVVSTRKTPWGLLDKRAVHLGGGGTHRLGLSDAILIKNNHLALLAPREEDAVEAAIERAWACREGAAFIEVEVRSLEAAAAAARTFRRLREGDSSACPSLLLLDNMSPGQARETLDVLRSERLLDDVLVEISGAISESNFDEYAACGADALSMGALTHSPRALDLSLRIS